MPNPFLRSQLNTSQNPTRPKPITPVPEKYQGHNQTWRGIETHGVEPTGDPAQPITDTVNIDGRNTKVEYEKAPEITEPVPVRIVQEYAREYRMLWTDRILAAPKSDGTFVQILGEDPNRITAEIRNTHATVALRIASNSGDLPLRGFPIAPGQSYKTTTETAVYAVCDDYQTTNSPVYAGIACELVVPENSKTKLK